MQQNQSHRYSTQYGATLVLLGLLFLTVFGLSKASASEACEYQIQQYAVAQNIKLNGVDQPNAATWQTLQQLPHYWNTLWTPFESNAWYKIDWQNSCLNAKQKPLSLVLENLNLAGEIYLNDELLWRSQQLQEPYSRHLHSPLHINISGSQIQQKQNTFLIHVYGTATQQAGLGKVHIQEQLMGTQIYQQLHFEKRGLNFFNFSINLVITLFCFLVWAFYPKYKPFLWFGIAGLFWALYVGIVNIVQPPAFLTNLAIDQITILLFCWFAFFATLSIWRFVDKSYPKIERVLLLSFIIASLLLIFTPELYQAALHKYIFIFAVTVYMVKAITYPIVIYKTPYKEAYFLLINQYIFVIVGIHDAHYMLTQQGSAWSPYTLPLSSLFFGVILALHLARSNRKILAFNKVLKQSVQDAKEELEQSLSKQHELNVQNAKLQERIALAHDLHDGLGASIVRALMITDHHQIDQQQMRSILKLLRNDLRQVIDSGSVAGAQPPDTPILWVANLRRRFSEILEDLNIQTQWNIPTEWQSLPSPLVCLTLSRILEEALTNVLKHSQATQVIVELQQTKTQLILTIEDNGQGFDVQSVADGMHVGLTSMRSRAFRLGGNLDVQSTEQHTLIQVRLPVQPSQ